MEAGPGGVLTLREQDFAAALENYSGSNEPVTVFGFTYVLYAYAVLPLLKAGRRFRLPPGSHIVHIGGWKKLADQQVSRALFNETMEQVFGVPATQVVDFYGFTEQMGVTYPDGPDGLKIVPAFADVIVRDPSTFKPLPDGREGLLEFVTPLPYSYPGIAVLTDDVGVVTARMGRRAAGTERVFRFLAAPSRRRHAGAATSWARRYSSLAPGHQPPKPSYQRESACFAVQTATMWPAICLLRSIWSNCPGWINWKRWRRVCVRAALSLIPAPSTT